MREERGKRKEERGKRKEKREKRKEERENKLIQNISEALKLLKLMKL